MKRLRIVAIAALAMTVGCAGVEVDEDELPAGAVEVPDEPIVYEPYSGIEEARREVIRSPAAWQAFWAELTENMTPRPALPEVDFGREIVIAAAMGRRPTGGYSITIEDVYRTPAGLFAVVVETEPAPDCVVTQALSAPVYVTRVPITGVPATFLERERVRSCE